jgi:hypothetical protein
MARRANFLRFRNRLSSNLYAEFLVEVGMQTTRKYARGERTSRAWAGPEDGKFVSPVGGT